MDPSRLKEWISIARDAIIVALGTFLAIYAVATIHEATVLGIVLGFSGTLLGVPAALRLDQVRRKQNGNGNEREDRWSHLP